jgi:uncharacterized Ntn-hydrolase superfamily protein
MQMRTLLSVVAAISVAAVLAGIGMSRLTGPHTVSVSRVPPDSARLCNTFSIVAYDPALKKWGVGTASKVLAVGARVPWAKAGVGAIATQSYSNLTYGPRGLDLLGKGRSAEDVVKLLIDADPGRDARQVAVVDSTGKAFAFTGKGCHAWCGEKVAEHYVCLGNLLSGKEVVEAMSVAFEKVDGPLAWRLMAALEAGERAGGDKRGKQSAAILVVGEKEDDLGYGGTNLRVDDHEQPVQELARILALELPRGRQ